MLNNLSITHLIYEAHHHVMGQMSGTIKGSEIELEHKYIFKKKIKRQINASFRRLYQCQSKIFSTFLSKITKYNRVPLGFDPSVARLLGHDPTPRPTCPD